MELKLRKKINNNLPKFNNGANGLYGPGLNYYITGQPYFLTAQQATVPTIGGNFLPIVGPGTNVATGVNNPMSTLYINPNNMLVQNVNVNLKGTSGLNELQLMLGGQVVQDAINLGIATNNAFLGTKKTEELVSDAGTYNDLVMGIGYKHQKYIDEHLEEKMLSAESTKNTLATTSAGAALGGGVGGLIAGLGGGAAAGGAAAGAGTGAIGGSFVAPIVGTAFGAIAGAAIGMAAAHHRKKKLQRRLKKAQILANLTNLLNRGAAMTAGLQLNYGLDYSNTQDDILYANRGKDLRQPIFR